MQSIWVRQTVANLKKIDTVRKVSERVVRFTVKFTDDTFECFSYRKRPRHWHINRRNGTFRNEATPRRLYEPDLLSGIDDLPHQLVVPRRGRNLIELLVGGHRLIQAMHQHGYDGRQHQKVLDREWHRLVDTPHLLHLLGQSTLIAWPRTRKRAPGRFLQHHYFDLTAERPTSSALRRSISEIYETPSFLAMTMRHIVKKGCALSTNSMISRISKLAGPTLWPAGIYVTLFSILNVNGWVKGPILDLHPDLGHKAMACAALGLEYMATDCPLFETACQRGFVSRVGLKFGSGRPGLVLCDRNFRLGGILSEIDSLRTKYRGSLLLVAVDPNERGAMAAYNPRLQLKLCLDIHHDPAAYLFIL